MAEVAKESGAEAYLIDEVGEIEENWLEGKKVLGITSGASAPEYRVQEIIDYFAKQKVEHEELVFQEEDLDFAEPMEFAKMKKEDN